MGRIKSTMIKRTAEKLNSKNKLSKDFEENKKSIHGVTPSKKVRNKIAGYITKLNSPKKAQ